MGKKPMPNVLKFFIFKRKVSSQSLANQQFYLLCLLASFSGLLLKTVANGDH